MSNKELAKELEERYDHQEIIDTLDRIINKLTNEEKRDK